MSFLLVFFIISLVATLILILCTKVLEWDDAGWLLTGIIGIITFILFILTIAQFISLKKEALRQEKEREQIVYQIKNLTENSDKIKLNEWILTYNDWVNDVNTSKEVYGWFSWYYDFDMTNHTIIDLV